MIKTRTLYVVVRPEEINGHLAAYGGKVLVHLPNYFVASATVPAKPADGSSQVFKILVEPKDINEFTDGGKPMCVLWRGDHRSRSNPQDLVSVEVLPLDATIGPDTTAAVATALPTEVCKAAFSEFPAPVQIAAVLSQAEPALVDSLPTAPGQLKVWAESTLNAFLASTK